MEGKILMPLYYSVFPYCCTCSFLILRKQSNSFYELYRVTRVVESALMATDKENVMKYAAYTLLAVTALSFPITQAKAVDLGLSGATGTAVQMGVDTPVVNSQTQVRTQTSTHMQNDGQHYHRRDVVTEEQQHYGDNDVQARTQHNMHARVAPQNINPAAGHVPPSARVMGRIQGGTSYND